MCIMLIMKKFNLPFGVEDYLPKDCYTKQVLEQKITDIFFNAGFDKIETGEIEYFDLYDGVLSRDSLNKTFKFTDTDGQLLVLRPDTTMQVLRLASNKLDSDISKLYYIQKSFEFLPTGTSHSARSREFSQIGIEILGNSGIAGDIEAVVLAINALKAAGLKDFIIELGHVDFLNGILGELNLSKNDLDELRDIVNSKDALGLEIFISKNKFDTDTVDVFKNLNSLFGGQKTLKKARDLVKNKMSLNALDGLEKTINALKEVDLGDYVKVDLGLVNRGAFYSGMTLKGMVKGFGVSILEGGRYDNLAASFGKYKGAIGFAIGTKRLIDALKSQGTEEQLPLIDIAYINLDGFCKTEYDYINNNDNKNKRIIKLFNYTKKQLTDYCKQNNIKKAVIFKDKKTEEIEVKL